MRPGRLSGIASILTAALLLCGNELCLLVACAPDEAHELAHGETHQGCSASDPSPDGHDGNSDNDCARPCRMLVELVSGPQVSSPRTAGHVSPCVVPSSPAVAVHAGVLPIGRAPPTSECLPPPSISLDAYGVRGPPTA